MAKSGLIKPKPQPSSAAADQWVSGSVADPIPAGKGTAGEATKRLTFDISEDVHRRLMVDCASQGVKMATVLRQMIEERWPERGQ